MENSQKFDFAAISAKAAELYTAGMLLWLPLYLYNGYFRLIKGKFAFFMFYTVLAVGCVLLCKYLNPDGGLRAHKKISFDVFWMLLLCAIYCINTFFAADPAIAFWGLTGRYNGCLMLLLCTAAYLITKTISGYRSSQLMINVFILSADITAILGWLNFFKIDPLDLFYSLTPDEAKIFLSNMGNINFFGALMAMAAPAAIYLFMYAKHGYAYAFSGVLLASALIPARSDGAWLGFFAAMAIMLCSRKLPGEKASRALAVLGAAQAAGAAAIFLTQMFPSLDEMKGFSAIWTSPWMLAAAGFFFVFAAVLKNREKSAAFLFRLITGAVMLIAVLLIAAANCTALLPEKISASLKFGPQWGSNRGYVWGRLLYCFFYKLTPLQMLLGLGGDGANAVINPAYTNYIVALNGSTFDSAHNVYLQQLLCGGLLGLTAWCGFWIQRGVQCFKNNRVVFYVLTAYCVQAFFSIDMPAVLPAAVMLSAMAGSDHTQTIYVMDLNKILPYILLVGVSAIYILPAVINFIP